MAERIVNDPSQHGWVEVDGKWMWDASGGGDTGNFTFSGNTISADGAFGLEFSSNDDLVPSKVGVDIGTNTTKFKDGKFSGDVSATSFTGSGANLTGVLKSFTETDPTVPPHVKGITQANINDWNAAASSSGGGGLPDGGYTYSWSITAADFIATSDRRVKKNIVTAPTGVIEKIRGVEFEWKESGQLSSGVIAQELEAVPELAHLVHTGEEEGTKHVSYLGLIGYLIEEVKALRAEIEGLK